MLTSSIKARFEELDHLNEGSSIFDALKSPNYQSDRYNVSKLLEVLIIRELAPAMTASRAPVILNNLTPGFCHSELMRHATFPLSFFGWLGK
jgi:retinol dehydrogenase-12